VYSSPIALLRSLAGELRLKLIIKLIDPTFFLVFYYKVSVFPFDTHLFCLQKAEIPVPCIIHWSPLNIIFMLRNILTFSHLLFSSKMVAQSILHWIFWWQSSAGFRVLFMLYLFVSTAVEGMEEDRCWSLFSKRSFFKSTLFLKIDFS